MAPRGRRYALSNCPEFGDQLNQIKSGTAFKKYTTCTLVFVYLCNIDLKHENITFDIHESSALQNIKAA